MTTMVDQSSVPKSAAPDRHRSTTTVSDLVEAAWHQLGTLENITTKLRATLSVLDAEIAAAGRQEEQLALDASIARHPAGRTRTRADRQPAIR